MNVLQAQQQAANPQASCWVAASAGSGKTKVLIDRLVNLLLQGVEPERILCLTFTRAAAAEMMQRLNQRLRTLAILNDDEAAAFMAAQDFSCLKDPRTLFLGVLETAPKIQTIHSFCQNLLQQFPLEAGISSHFRILNEDERVELINQCLDEVFQQMPPAFTYWGEQRFRELAWQCLMQAEMSDYLQRPLEVDFTQLLPLSADWQEPTAETMLIQTFSQQQDIDPIEIDTYCARFLTQTGDIRKAQLKVPETRYIAETVKAFHEKCMALRVAQKTRDFLDIMRPLAAAYHAHKHSRQAFDFSDLISLSLQLLQQSDMAAWILYKLAGGTEHLLIDEAQDTSREQWQFIQLLANDLLGCETRTLFAVGDPKQSIYGFQGADPQHFLALQRYFQEKTQQQGGLWRNVALDVSFRTAPEILYSVDTYFQENPRGVSFTEEKFTHQSFRTAVKGQVVFWPLVKASPAELPEAWSLPSAEENQADPQRQAAVFIAAQVRYLLMQQDILPATRKPIEAGDILILVKRRSPFVDALIQALKRWQIPVAGADRLVLTDHLAIQDLIAFGRFLLLPEDDFNLACLLKSPLIGCDEESLFSLCYQRSSGLWQQLQQDPQWLTTTQWLEQWLVQAPFLTPYQLYSTLLTKGGHEKICERFGAEVGEVVDEFLALALAHGDTHTASLQTFLHFLQSVPPTLQRQAIQDNTVRVMTVHGSKGLEAPVVIIVDSPDVQTATLNPFLFYNEKGCQGFLLRPRSEEDCALTQSLKKQQEQQAWEEDNRLLYVAMTRAKDRLYLAGWENQRGKASWYHKLVAALNPVMTQETLAEVMTLEQQPQNRLPQWLNSLPAMSVQEMPVTFAATAASERGIRIHRLLEILPTLPTALHWQIAQRILGDLADAAAVFEQVQAILTHPEWAPFFGPNSIAELPILSQVNGQAQSLRIDRVLIQPGRVAILDYKTQAIPPVTTAAIPFAMEEQLAFYAWHLRKLYPQHQQDVSILWTANLTLMPVPFARIESHFARWT